MERREPTLSSSSANPPERDEPTPRRSSPPPPEPRATRIAPVAIETSSSSSNGLAIVALLVGLAGVGVGGFFGMKLTEAQDQIVLADARIAELEGRLSMSSDEASQSLTQVDAKLKWADAEIRKLWGVANDVNRKAISANTEKITGLTRDLAATKKLATDAKGAADSLEPQLAASKTAVENSVAKIDSAVAGITEQRKLLQDLTEQIDRTEAQLANLRALEEKTRTNEEAIAAIDAYRRTLNRDILQIKQQLGVPAN